MEWQTIVGSIVGILLIFCIPIIIFVIGTTIAKISKLQKNHKVIFGVTIFVLLYSVLILIMR